MARLVGEQGTARGERGAVLGFAIMTAFLASLVSYAMLGLAVSQTRHATFHRGHAIALHAAEVGLVWGQQRLMSNPAYCGAPDPPAINGIAVDVTVAPCVGPAPRTVTAKVIY